MGFATIVLASSLVTSVMSGVLGMAGGMILMAILVAVAPVSTAMVVHGAVQATSNGSRAWFLRRHVAWRVLPTYLAGAALALGAFVMLLVVPNAAYVMILIGVFPWLARVVPHLKGLDVTKPLTSFVCGTVVTGAQLFAGASGPLLDVFYLNTPLDRYQIIANKALTQTLGHVLKLVYYGAVLTLPTNVSLPMLGAAMLTAVLGARLGTRLLDKLDDSNFRRYSGYVILAVGAYCVISGVTTLLRA